MNKSTLPRRGVALARKISARAAEFQGASSAWASNLLFEQRVRRALTRSGAAGLLHPDRAAHVAIHGTSLKIYLETQGGGPAPLPMGSDSPDALRQFLTGQTLRRVELISEGRVRSLPELASIFNSSPEQASIWLSARTSDDGSCATVGDLGFRDALDELGAHPELMDFYARGIAGRIGAPSLPEPFTRPEQLPDRVEARPRKRSAVLLHNSYYHFNVLAAGLRRQGWDVLTVALEPPDSPQQQFFHGEDLNLHHPDPMERSSRTAAFFRTIPERFEAVHFYGQFQSSLFPQNYSSAQSTSALPWDFLELRRHNVLIGYMPSGCLDGGLQSSIRTLSGGVCAKCVWELRPDICNDQKNGTWNYQLDALCDWVGLECDYATPERISRKSVYGPVVTTVDPDAWRPGLPIPEKHRLAREEDEVLIYHGVGNYATRRAHGRDIKGTGAILQAVERLQHEGHKVRLVFIDNVSSRDVKYVQAQVDIVVDQLNYGRYGATARETLMLGQPVICHLNAKQAAPIGELRPIREVPIASADETSIYDVLRGMIVSPEQRMQLGRRAREFALAWHGRDACAARYGTVLDRLRQGLPPDDDSLYPLASSADGPEATLSNERGLRP